MYVGTFFFYWIWRKRYCLILQNFLTAEHKKREVLLPLFFTCNRRRPTLPGRVQPSTISAGRLNFCVRNENRWIPTAIVTGMVECLSLHTHNCTVLPYPSNLHTLLDDLLSLLRPRWSIRPISIGKLNTLLCLHTRPIYLVVYKGSRDILSWGGFHA